MASYQYVAMNSSGKQKRGKVDADSPKSARARIREMGLMPVSISELSAQAAAASRNSGGKARSDSGSEGFSFARLFQPSMSSSALTLITRQISTLVSSAMPIEESLRAVSQQCENPKHAAIISGVREKVLEGHSLADAMRKYPRVFDDLYTAMVAAGERQIEAVLVAADSACILPCGNCLQKIAEFGSKDTVIYSADLKQIVKTQKLGEMLPQSFSAGDMQNA